MTWNEKTSHRKKKKLITKKQKPFHWELKTTNCNCMTEKKKEPQLPVPSMMKYLDGGTFKLKVIMKCK